jgi:hypothetical protein
MQLNGQNLVDVASVMPYYTKKGLSLDLLRQCNSQEFRFIDGYGKGHFLMTQTIESDHVTFSVGFRTVSLKVTDVLSLEHPNHSGGLKVYITAEPKYDLLDLIVERNYNITIDKSIPVSGEPTIVTLNPDYTPKTLEQVIDDILPSGYILDYNADTITPLDISIEGLSVFGAIDHLCSAYGLIWTSDGETVHIWDMQDSDNSSDITSEGQLTDPINDIYHTLLTDSPTNVNVAFPVYEYARQVPREYYVYEDSESTPSSSDDIVDGLGQGQTLNVMIPYHKAITNINGQVRNQSALDAIALIVIDNMKGIKKSYEYVVKEFFEALPLNYQPISLSEVYGDWGQGPRSIYRWIPYPYVLAKKPKSKARYAKNFVGTIAEDYNGPVETIYVTPEFGLDGKIPPGTQPVRNLYNWDYGLVGWYIRVEWDCVNRRWIPITQEYECPPEETSISISDSVSESVSVEFDPYPLPCADEEDPE